MGKQGERRLVVSIYLLRPTHVTTAKATLFSSQNPGTALRSDIPNGQFIAFPGTPDQPHWIAFVQTLLPDAALVDSIVTQVPGALLWIPHSGKQFVISFGYAHSLLRDEWVEPEFGKRVALSVIPQHQVVEMRAEQVFARRHVASERAPRVSSVRMFGFEPDRDLVAAVEGMPVKAHLDLLGNKVRGGTSFKLGLLFSRLLETLDTLSERFDSGGHKKSWPQVDNLIAVSDDTVIVALNSELDKLLGVKNPQDHIALAAPGSAAGDRPYPQHFVIGRMTASASTSPYLLFGNWEKWAKDQGKPLSVDTALDTPVHLLDKDKDELSTSTMYQCLATEVSRNRVPFILSSGVWWEAKRQFVNETDNYVAALQQPLYSLPSWNKTDDEGAYNLGASKLDKSIWLFDKKLVYIGGGRSSLEFCDLMHFKTKTLYFVKQPSASAGMSHLYEQVRRTVENFFSSDDDFRGRLKGNIRKDGRITNTSWLNSRPRRQDWNLCLVSMGKEASQLPFFARCGLARLIRELEQSGYNVFYQAV